MADYFEKSIPPGAFIPVAPAADAPATQTPAPQAPTPQDNVPSAPGPEGTVD